MSTIPSDVSELAGPMFLGHIFNWGLFGILSVQVYLYYLSFPNDTRTLKIVVYGLYALNIVQTIVTTNVAWTTFGSGWGNPDALSAGPKSLWFGIPFITGIIGCIVQCFYAWRIFVLSSSKVLAILICTISVVQAVAAMVLGILITRISDPSDLQVDTYPATSIWLAGSAVDDIIISISMVYFLSKHRSDVQSTNKQVSRIIRLIVGTGTITASVAIIDLVLFLTFLYNDIHDCPALILAKLYTNALLVVFNNRAIARRDANFVIHHSPGWDTFTPDENIHHVQSQGMTFDRSIALQNMPEIHVEINTEVHQEHAGSGKDRGSISRTTIQYGEGDDAKI